VHPGKGAQAHEGELDTHVSVGDGVEEWPRRRGKPSSWAGTWIGCQRQRRSGQRGRRRAGDGRPGVPVAQPVGGFCVAVDLASGVEQLVAER